MTIAISNSIKMTQTTISPESLLKTSFRARFWKCLFPGLYPTY